MPSPFLVGLKRLEHETSHSSPSSAELKYEQSDIYAERIRLFDLHRDNLAFTYVFYCTCINCYCIFKSLLFHLQVLKAVAAVLFFNLLSAAVDV